MRKGNRKSIYNKNFILNQIFDEIVKMFTVLFEYKSVFISLLFSSKFISTLLH